MIQLITILGLIFCSQALWAQGMGGSGGGQILRIADKKQPVHIIVCEDGDVQPFVEHENGDSFTVFRTCKNGSYYSKPVYAEPIRCRDGDVYPFHDEADSRSQVVFKECIDGRFTGY